MKTYTTGQVIDLLKLGQKARCIEGHFKGRELCFNPTYRCIVWNDEPRNEVEISRLLIKCKWQLLPQYVTFEEAVKAYKEGKRIEYENGDESGGFWMVNGSAYAEVRWTDIVNAKWWVEEDSQ